ncbi:MAG: putative RNA methyltransferase [Thermoleophilaceae bacterium]
MQQLLACPVCGAGLARRTDAMRCGHGHSFDIARQGYVNLLARDAPAGLGDTAEMLAARAAFLDAGHFDSLIEAVAEAAQEAAGDGPGAVVDIGAGTGHYLAATLDRMPGRQGLALDASRHAARRAARAHPRAGAAVCDVWRAICVCDGAARVVIDVFAPRNGEEIARVLAPGGTLIVVTPTQRHLAELREPLAMLAVDERKEERLNASLAPQLCGVQRDEVEARLTLDRRALGQLVAMGPSAYHTDSADLAERISAQPESVYATASVTLTRWRLAP